MVAELKAAYAAKKPIVMMFWAPHWIFAEYKFHWVKLPPYSDKCGTDPKLGMYPDKLNDCGFAQAHIGKVVWKGFKAKWPAAYKLVENVKITNDMQNKMMLQIDNKGRKLDDVINEWLKANKSTWEAWIKGATM
jgi:glycine betaine/proline transport system substrate-binding protein